MFYVIQKLLHVIDEFKNFVIKYSMDMDRNFLCDSTLQKRKIHKELP